MATLPTVQNAVELENRLLESLRERALAAGFEFLSALIEDRLRETGPAWFRSAAILERIDNYLRSGNTFAYLQVALQPEASVQGALELIDTLAHWLKTLTGMPAIALSPAAGAHPDVAVRSGS